MGSTPSVVLCQLSCFLTEWGESPLTPPTAPHRFLASDSCSTGSQLVIWADGPDTREANV